MVSRGLVTAVLLVMAALHVLPSAAAGPASAVTVTPSTGSAHAHFVVRFTAPAVTGRAGETNRRYVVSAVGPARAGCDANPGASAPPTRAGQHVSVTLIADRRGWCTGAYRGRIAEYASPVCSPGRECPDYVGVVKQIARFGFRVR